LCISRTARGESIFIRAVVNSYFPPLDQISLSILHCPNWLVPHDEMCLLFGSKSARVAHDYQDQLSAVLEDERVLKLFSEHQVGRGGS
jgi:hypothetical protein